MVKSFKTLIRFRKFELDEKRREMGLLLAHLMHLEAVARDLENQISAEQKAAADHPQTAGFAYAGFARAAINKRAELAALIAAKKQEIDDFSLVVTEAFKALKTTEISEENRVAAQQAQLNQKERNMLDEIGTNRFLRKQQD